jgi:hypothetical protein
MHAATQANQLKACSTSWPAAQIKDLESRSDVARGNALEILDLQSKAAILQAQQDSLTLRLQGNDLQRQLADVLGLPVDIPHLAASLRLQKRL